MLCLVLLLHVPGVMPYRNVHSKLVQEWKDLAAVFDRMLGGSPASQKGAAFLRALASNTLPANELIPLPWHESDCLVQVMPNAREEPHPVVLATLCPSVALRAVWRRRR